MHRLREQLGVRVDVFDESDDKEKDGGKKKKATHSKSKVKVSQSVWILLLPAHNTPFRLPVAKRMPKRPRSAYSPKLSDW